MFRVSCSKLITPALRLQAVRFGHSGSSGSGSAGVGGSSGIRESGGAFGKREKAIEEQYFKKKDHEEVEYLKTHKEELDKLKKGDKKPEDKANK